jgi:hypothetical protein
MRPGGAPQALFCLRTWPWGSFGTRIVPLKEAVSLRTTEKSDGPLNYEKAHKTRNIINAIKETKIIPRLELRIRLSDGGA